MNHGFGWHPSTPRPLQVATDRALQNVLRVRVALQTKIWDCASVLDQGTTPHCVGFCGVDECNAEPIPNTFVNQDGHNLYYQCKVIDGEPGMENGSTMRSLMQALSDDGHLQSYTWATTLDEIEQWIVQSGPVMVGTNWTNDMESPDAQFVIHPTGPVVGGHAYLLLGYRAEDDMLVLLNSWGEAWGQHGRAYIPASEWFQLFLNQGEAAAGVEIPGGPIPVPPSPGPGCLTAIRRALGLGR